MATKTYTVAFRRRREGKTNYDRRMRLLKGETVRLVVRRSLQHIQARLVRYGETGDAIIATAHSRELEKFGWKLQSGNVMAAYLVGLLIAKKAREHKINEAVLDIGQYRPTKGGRLYAVLKGALDGGLKIPHSADVLPSEDRISGRHVEAIAGKTKGFARYQAQSIDPAQITKLTAQVKAQIMR